MGMFNVMMGVTKSFFPISCYSKNLLGIALSKNLYKPSTTELISGKTLFTASIQHKTKKNQLGEELDEMQDADGEKNHQAMVNEMLHVPMNGHQVLVIQPYVKWGEMKRRNTTPDLQLSEAAALVASLPNWTVVQKITVPLRNLNKKVLFGMGNLKALKEKVVLSKNITAVFISVDNLQIHQQKELETIFRVPVYDRYMIVIQIFRMHAKTREAKLQIAMAEIPFLWSHLKDISGTMEPASGTGESFGQMRKMLLSRREVSIRRQLKRLREHRQLLRKNRGKYPVVAVVGYTNAGKTSLIEALTGDTRMQPCDSLFATLDVTTHAGLLPCQLKVLYIDTVGFISDIPTGLIESFVATLEDAMLADVILHVRDISHPDTNAQNDIVLSTLQQLNLSDDLLNNIIVVGNKVDLVPSDGAEKNSDVIPVSALHHIGLEQLKHAIEVSTLRTTGRVKMVFRVPSGSDEARWLFKDVAVMNMSVDPKNNDFVLIEVVISELELSKFRRQFIE